MHKKLLLSAVIASLCAATSAHAAITSGQLIAIGSLSGSSAGANTDLSGLTGLLENGVAGNSLGGIGSGLAWAGGNTFIATPDRGPNAVAYNSAVDDTSSYISRFQTVTLDLTANTSGTGLAYNLTPTLTATTLLSSATTLNYGTGAGLGNQLNGAPLGSGVPTLNLANSTNYFTGRSDNFGTANALGAPNSSQQIPATHVSIPKACVFPMTAKAYLFPMNTALMSISLTAQRVSALNLLRCQPIWQLPMNLLLEQPNSLQPKIPVDELPIKVWKGWQLLQTAPCWLE